MAEFFGQKWGESNAFGTPGNVVTWSVASGGVDIIGLGFAKSTTSSSLGSFISFNFVEVIRAAFEIWSDVANIEFVQVEDGGGAHATGMTGDIRIFGATMINNVVVGAAHGPTTAPFVHPVSGNIAISRTEDWTKNSFLAVVLHEIGHSIGLDHEDAVPAVMNSIADKTTLRADDISGARTIYGAQDFGAWVYDMRDGQKTLKILDVVDDLTVNGTSSRDVIIGGKGDEIMNGFNGNDELRGNAGDDELNGGSGADFLVGGNGNDTLRGSIGNDEMRGAGGNDDLFAGNGDDLLTGAGGSDELYGGANDDTLKGGGSSDVIEGGSGNDKLLGQGGADDMDGGSGNDVLIGGTGGDRMAGGTGNDRLKGRGGIDVFEYEVDGDADKIKDYEDGTDLIDLSDFGFASTAAALAFASQVGSDTVFAFGNGDKLTVEDTQIGVLDSGDLIL